jgi:hypothetical protein
MASSMSEAAKELLEKYPMNYEFTMKQFEAGVIRLYPQAKYNLSHTIDRRLREFREGKGYYINCIDKVKSRYKKEKAKREHKLRIVPKKERRQRICR